MERHLTVLTGSGTQNLSLLLFRATRAGKKNETWVSEFGARTEEAHVCDARSWMPRDEHKADKTKYCLLTCDVINRVELSWVLWVAFETKLYWAAILHHTLQIRRLEIKQNTLEYLILNSGELFSLTVFNCDLSSICLKFVSSSLYCFKDSVSLCALELAM